MASLLHPKVQAAVALYELDIEELACDPDFADTAAFNERYGFTPQESANTIIVASKKVEPVCYAVCVVLASTRLDVNKTVTKQLGVKKASFADAEITVMLSDMQIGGVTAIGLETLPVYVDSAVMNAERIVMGGGNRTSKVVLRPAELAKLPNVTVVENLAKLSEVN